MAAVKRVGFAASGSRKAHRRVHWRSVAQGVRRAGDPRQSGEWKRSLDVWFVQLLGTTVAHSRSPFFAQTLLVAALLSALAPIQQALARPSSIAELRELDESLRERDHRARGNLRSFLAATPDDDPTIASLRPTLACVYGSVEDSWLQSTTHSTGGGLTARSSEVSVEEVLEHVHLSESWVARTLDALESCAETMPEAPPVVRVDEARLRRRISELGRLRSRLVDLSSRLDARSDEADAQTLLGEHRALLEEHHAVFEDRDSTDLGSDIEDPSDEFSWLDADRYYGALGAPASRAEWPARSLAPMGATAAITGGLLAFSLLGSLGAFASVEGDSPRLSRGISMTWGFTISGAAAIVPAATWQRATLPFLVPGAALTLGTAVGGAVAIARGDENMRLFGGGLVGGSAIGLAWLAGGIAHRVFEDRQSAAWVRFLEGRLRIQPAIARESVGVRVGGVF